MNMYIYLLCAMNEYELCLHSFIDKCVQVSEEYAYVVDINIVKERLTISNLEFISLLFSYYLFSYRV